VLTETFRVFHTFRQDAESRTYSVLKSNPSLMIPYMTEGSKKEADLYDTAKGLPSI
jgi:hypothetical protein